MLISKGKITVDLMNQIADNGPVAEEISMIECDLNVGDDVSWVSAAGHLRGKIVGICIALNAARNLVPWITIERTAVRKDGTSIQARTRLCGTDSNLKMLQVTRLFDEPSKTWSFNNTLLTF
jgi:hypothetical protein